MEVESFSRYGKVRFYLDDKLMGEQPTTQSKTKWKLLRASDLWPAMHSGTKALNTNAENKVVADSYAIIMGSSHAQPMLRNIVGE